MFLFVVVCHFWLWDSKPFLKCVVSFKRKILLYTNSDQLLVCTLILLLLLVCIYCLEHSLMLWCCWPAALLIFNTHTFRLLVAIDLNADLLLCLLICWICLLTYNLLTSWMCAHLHMQTDLAATGFVVDLLIWSALTHTTCRWFLMVLIKNLLTKTHTLTDVVLHSLLDSALQPFVYSKVGSWPEP